ncbi:MAG: hypothetical protein A2252_01280 [Elusimicrobia bacterium RIFOXYA2_FULL_39_19]|nr:MAG: hypothetical protein A2252_01280 [Elusimicrobia bacterium RIFOXYA2_FULL_39_19]
MPQLRQNIAVREWVIIATERAKRPKDFSDKKIVKKDLPSYLSECPFCMGNENIPSIDKYAVKDSFGWKVRVVPNKFPALIPEDTSNFKIME